MGVSNNKNASRLALAFSVWEPVISALNDFLTFLQHPHNLVRLSVFAVIWWPLSFFRWYKRKKHQIGFPFSCRAAYNSPTYYYYAYYTLLYMVCIPIIGVVWWPVAMLLPWLREERKGGFLISALHQINAMRQAFRFVGCSYNCPVRFH
jgi:hypothetical protein